MKFVTEYQEKIWIEAERFAIRKQTPKKVMCEYKI